jgi:PAS domain-containing protein
MDRLADSDARPNDTAPDQLDPDDPMAGPLSDENWTEEMTAHFRAVVDISPDAIYINRQGRFAYVNQSAIDLFGAHSADDLIGRQVFSLMHEDDISPAKTTVRQLVVSSTDQCNTRIKSFSWCFKLQCLSWTLI